MFTLVCESSRSLSLLCLHGQVPSCHTRDSIHCPDFQTQRGDRCLWVHGLTTHCYRGSLSLPLSGPPDPIWSSTSLIEALWDSMTYLKHVHGIQSVAGFGNFVPFLGLTGKFHAALTLGGARLKAGGIAVLTDTITHTWKNKRHPYQIERSEVRAAQSVRCRLCGKGTTIL